MIPPRPRDEIELTTRDLRVRDAPAPIVQDAVEVVVAVAVHGAARDLSRCLASVAAQRIDKKRLGVIILRDQVSDAPASLALPPSLRERTWVLTANCGSPARARNALLEYVDRNLPACRWVARLDWDDRFAEEMSLSAAVALGEHRGAVFVLGGNRVLAPDGSLIRLNGATASLQEPAVVVHRLAEMASGTASNELPSCNLLLAAHSGVRYPDTASAEDHWLVADLLINHAQDGTILDEPLFVDYTLDGHVTQSARSAERYYEARRALYDAARVWEMVRHLPGQVLGLGQEGIVRLHLGTVHKHFYPGILTDQKARWLASALARSAIAPSPMFMTDEHTGGWLATYPYEQTQPFADPAPDAVRGFLLGCLAERLVCGNIKRSNFRVRSSGSLLYIDIGNWIVPMDVSVLRDSAARLFSIGVMGASDEEVLRRRADHTRPKIWERLPGFAPLYGEVVAVHVDASLAQAPRPEPRPVPRRHADVSLLIKACAMDAAYARDQIIHIVDQLVGPHDFADRALLVDTHTGSFLRQHAPGNLDSLLAVGRELVECGVLDRVLIAPSDSETLRQINRAWFNIDCTGSHSTDGVPIAPQVWGFDQIQTRYVLQCDIDSLVGRRNRDHDYLTEMLTACRTDGVPCVAFNIPHAPDGEFRPYAAPAGEYKPEVRCGLLDLQRLRALRPLPASVAEERLTTTWYRSLHAVQKERRLRTLRGGHPDTFYLHPPNQRKGDLSAFGRIRDLIAQGLVPRSQWDHWDLETPDLAWQYPRRSEAVVVVARGRNTEAMRLQRFAAGLAMQDDQAFGVVAIDDASDQTRPSELAERLGWLGERLTLIRHSVRHGRMLNNVIALRKICTNPESLIVVVDLDDTLTHRVVIGRLKHLAEQGHDVILAAPFRPDVPTKTYRPDFDHPRQTFGGDVWIHLRAFKKHLFDGLPDEVLQLDGQWLQESDDYAIMVPVAEAARNPIYIPEYFYLHERFTVLDEAGRRQRDAIIERILANRLAPI